LAGYFHSELGISAGDRFGLMQAIKRVFASYLRNGRVPHPIDQIIIQLQIQQVTFSGVVLTREPITNAPYYIINYDSITGLTDTVTKGLVSQALRVARWQEPRALSSPWDNLLVAIQEIERVFPQSTLKVEFGIDRSYNIHTFQVCPLKIHKIISNNDEKKHKDTIAQLKTEFERLTSNVYNLPGTHTILADMPDWNPAEIIGSRPNILDYSLYRFLVTKCAWNQARVSIGYRDVAPSELMVMFANKPYIDTRVSFNSLTPNGLPPDFRETLINYYLNKLENQPQLQDKVEFEIVFSCFDLSFDDKTSELKGIGVSEDQIDDFKQFLSSFTNSLLQKSTKVFFDDLKAVQKFRSLQKGYSKELLDLHQLLSQSYQLLTSCREFGVIPFSRLARLTFVGLAIFKSLLKQGIINEPFYNNFLNSIETVATRMAIEFHQLTQGKMDLKSFLTKYGHLRPGTYNILAPRYDRNPNLFTGLEVSNHDISFEKKFRNDQTMIARIDRALAKNGIEYSAQSLLDFIRKAIEYREYAKFEFTKYLSDAIELIARVGEQIGFSRQELALIDLDTIIESLYSKSFDLEYIKGLWGETINKNREIKTRYEKIALPPVIIQPRDLVVVPYYESYPNFVTRQRVEGTVCFLTSINYDNIPNVADKIILLENADPGFDWIFTKNPKGLITKYGGVASHMAVRCAEFGLPAAIGCGEVIFDRLSNANLVLLDCTTETIVPM
jgi:phosphohistidine swiveling domain-containing protein